MRVEDYSHSIRKNKKAILKALSSIHAERVTVDYSGSGDSGCIDGVEITGAEKDIGAVSVKVEECSSRFEPGTQKWVEAITQSSMSLEKAIEGLCYDLLSTNHGGWENNDGADGRFDFDVATGKISWTHNEFYTESNTTEYEV